MVRFFYYYNNSTDELSIDIKDWQLNRNLDSGTEKHLLNCVKEVIELNCWDDEDEIFIDSINTFEYYMIRNGELIVKESYINNENFFEDKCNVFECKYCKKK